MLVKGAFAQAITLTVQVVEFDVRGIFQLLQEVAVPVQSFFELAQRLSPRGLPAILAAWCP